jgi:hypothetical protein
MRDRCPHDWCERRRSGRFIRGSSEGDQRQPGACEAEKERNEETRVSEGRLRGRLFLHEISLGRAEERDSINKSALTAGGGCPSSWLTRQLQNSGIKGIKEKTRLI